MSDKPMTKDELILKIRNILKNSQENSITIIMIQSVIDVYVYGQKETK